VLRKSAYRHQSGPRAKIKILTLQIGLAAKEVAAHGEADSPSFKASKIRHNIAHERQDGWPYLGDKMLPHGLQAVGGKFD
jgi:hypothetical protein